MEHLARIQKAVDHIETLIGTSSQDAVGLNPETIARVAGFSMWHFQRVFSAAVGHPLKDYIRRRRLSLSLKELAKPEPRILDIALDAGFESQEAFTRAFKDCFGVTPGDARKSLLGDASKSGGINLTLMAKPRITYEYLDHLYGGITMEPTYINVPEKHYVGVAGTFISVLSPEKNNMTIIPALWQRYIPRAQAIPNRKSPVDVGVCAAVPDAERKHPEECFYMAGTEVSSLAEIPEGMTGRSVPEGNYAVFIHKGKLDTIEHTMRYIYGSWLPRSGKKLRQAPDLEVYGPKFKLNQDDSELEIQIPIE
jgi:AraC family transcriptional regulator